MKMLYDKKTKKMEIYPLTFSIDKLENFTGEKSLAIGHYKISCSVVNGELHGIFQMMHKNTIIKQGLYCNNKRQGPWFETILPEDSEGLYLTIFSRYDKGIPQKDSYLFFCKDGKDGKLVLSS